MNLKKNNDIVLMQPFNTQIINTYNQMFNGTRTSLPPGTWQVDENVVRIVRYALEDKLGLSREEIPKISRKVIEENKLWGALNRFKSLHKLIHFVYPNEYHECDFNRVTPDYWSDTKKLKERFEWFLQKEEIQVQDIPKFIDNKKLIEWGLSNPLKRHGYSSFRLLQQLYPNKFKETDFKKTPAGYRKDIPLLKKHFRSMLSQEKIAMKDVPEKVTRAMLVKYRFGGVICSYSNSVSALITAIFPEYFSIHDFKMKPNNYWDDLTNAKFAIENLLNLEGRKIEEIPVFLTKKKLQEAKLGGLLHHFHGSPIEIVNALYPGQFSITQFIRVPNKYWQVKENRENALRSYCLENGIISSEIPKLNRAYFQSHFPRFVSLADRYYDSKFHKWIIESFPEHEFKIEQFQLLIGNDAQICDSKEELVIHNLLLQLLPEAEIVREAEKFINGTSCETYIPDWIIEENGKKYIIEYFGLYKSSRYKGYTEKTERKLAYYGSLTSYKFIAIFPEDIKRDGKEYLTNQLMHAGLTVVYNKDR